MKVLFVHQNFPGQFKHVAQALAADPANKICALALRDLGRNDGVGVHAYTLNRGSTPKLHPWVSEVEAKLIRAEAAYDAAKLMAFDGFTPDVIVAHPGWGESLLLKEVWPKAKLLIYCEFYYGATDVQFDPEFVDTSLNDPARLRVKNMNQLLHFDIADAAISPTAWQKSLYPEFFQPKISVIHEGIDTRKLLPNPQARLKIGGRIFSKQDQVITFINRNLEPYRGYHVFMRALPELLARNPKAHVMIVGGDGVSYGRKPPQGESWKQIFLGEVADRIDMSRVHFLGKIPYEFFVALMQLSSLHVYLTYPFVLSWSTLEAMSCGCAIVGSKTPPVEEVITHGENGLLVDFFDGDALIDAVSGLLQKRGFAQRLGKAARETAVNNYDLETICLPKTLALIRSLA